MRDEPGPVSRIGRSIPFALLGVLLLLLLVRTVGVYLDFAAVIRYPFGLEYGEGYIWQQTALIPGPLMYGTSQGMPFFITNYPPVYYLLTHAASSIDPDFLAAGRLVSSLSTVLIALSVGGLVWLSIQRPGRPTVKADFAIALTTALLVLSLPLVHYWGALMRVDVAAVALGMLGLLVGAWADGRFWGTTLALLICVAAIFTKQTQLTFGIAVFLIALLRNPRSALSAAAIAGLFSLAALGLMEELTAGGFLHNIIGYNINRFVSLRRTFLGVFWPMRSNSPFVALILVAAGATVFGLFHQFPIGVQPSAARPAVLRLRSMERASTARAMLLLNIALASLMLLTTMKFGAASNYLLGWVCGGCALIGVLLCDLASAAWRFSLATTLLILSLLVLSYRKFPDQYLREQSEWQTALVHRIAATKKPVASEDMGLLMRAGKTVFYEPFLATELAEEGHWNEAPLVRMTRAAGFAFFITADNTVGGSARRSPAVDAAMREAYPQVERVGPDLWLHLPAR